MKICHFIRQHSVFAFTLSFFHRTNFFSLIFSRKFFFTSRAFSFHFIRYHWFISMLHLLIIFTMSFRQHKIRQRFSIFPKFKTSKRRSSPSKKKRIEIEKNDDDDPISISDDDAEMNPTWSDDNESVFNIDELAERLKSIDKKKENVLLSLNID